MNRFSPLSSAFLGFDTIFNEMERQLSGPPIPRSVYPPMNLYKEDNDYTIELAIAGFKEADIEVMHDERHGTLQIRGDTTRPSEKLCEVVARGIASRTFIRTFNIADNLTVDSASLEDGLLTIKLRADEALAYTPRQIPLSKPLPSPPEPESTTDKLFTKLTGKKKTEPV